MRLSSRIGLHRSRLLGSRQGAMLPLIALLLPVMLVFLGFAVDLAYMQTTRLELRAAADCAARAAATRLSQTDSEAEAIQAAVDIAGENMVAGAPLLLRSSEIVVGRSAPNGSGKWVFSDAGTPKNSVRITAQRNDGSRSGPVPLFFGSLIGTPTFQPVQAATASFMNVDICLVLDRSSSMKLSVAEVDRGMSSSDSRFCSPPDIDSRWTALDTAIDDFLAELADSAAEEHVALATYSGALSGYCGGSSDPSSLDRDLSSDLSRIQSAMDSLNLTVWNGNTYIESGMRTGLSALQDARLARDTAEKIMIVLTDGNQNVGNAMNAARECATAKIIVHSITFGDGADQDLMRNVANTAGGQHYHANDTATLRRVFRELAAQTSRLTE